MSNYHAHKSCYVPDYINSKDEQERLLYLEMSVDNTPEEEIKTCIEVYRTEGIKAYRAYRRDYMSRLGSTQSSIISPSSVIISKYS